MNSNCQDPSYPLPAKPPGGESENQPPGGQSENQPPSSPVLKGMGTRWEEPISVSTWEQGLDRKFPEGSSAPDTDGTRPTSASSSSSSFSEVSGDMSASSTTQALTTKRRSRKTWRQSIQEQDDELNLLSAGDVVVKCKAMQCQVRELETELLEVNTQNTRLQNTQVTLQQTQIQSEQTVKTFKTELEELKSQGEAKEQKNKDLHELCTTMNVKLLKVTNELLNAQTETGKALRELDISRKNSNNHSKCQLTEERLMGTVAALKKELNHMRDDVADLNNKLDERETMTQDLRCELETLRKKNAEAIDDTYNIDSLKAIADDALQKVASHTLQIDVWMAKTVKMLSMCDLVLTSESVNGDLDEKSKMFSQMMEDLDKKLCEEADYSKHFQNFINEAVVKLGAVLGNDFSLDHMKGRNEGFKFVIALVDQACQRIQMAGRQSVDSEIESLAESMDTWAERMREAITMCQKEDHGSHRKQSNAGDVTVSTVERATKLTDLSNELCRSVKQIISTHQGELHLIFLSINKYISEIERDLGLGQFKKVKSVFTTQDRLSQVIENLDSFRVAIESLQWDKTTLQSEREAQSTMMQDLLSKHGNVSSEANRTEGKLGGDFNLVYGKLQSEFKATHSLVQKKEEVTMKWKDLQISKIVSCTDEDAIGDAVMEIKPLVDQIEVIAKGIHEKEKLCMDLLMELRRLYDSQQVASTDTEGTSSQGDNAEREAQVCCTKKVVKELKEQQQQNIEQRELIAGFTAKISDYEVQLATTKGQCAHIQVMYDAVVKRSNMTNEKAGTAEGLHIELDQVKKDLLLLEAEKSNLRTKFLEELQIVNDKSAELVGEVTELTTNNVACQLAVKELTEERSKHQALIQRLNEDVDALRDEIQHGADQMSTIEAAQVKEVDLLKQKIKELDDVSCQLRNDQSLQVDIGCLESAKNQALEELVGLRFEHKQHLSVFEDRMRDDHRLHENEVSHLQAAIDALKTDSTKLDMQVRNELEKEYKAQLADLESQLARQKMCSEELTAKVVQQVLDLDRLQIELEQKNVEQQSISAEETARLQRAVDGGSKQAVALQELTTAFEELQAVNISLSAKNASLAMEKATMEEKVSDHESRKAKSDEECGNLRREVERLKGSLEEKDCKLSQLNKVLSGKDGDVAAYAEQCKQHALTIVAIEERLNKVVEKNKLYRSDIEKHQQEIRHYRSRIEENEKEAGKQGLEAVTLVTPPVTQVPAQPKLVIHNPPPASQQFLVRMRRENANLKHQNEQAQKVVAGLRRDITGLAARLGDVAGEIDEAKKKEIDENRIKLSDNDREMADHKAKVKDLFKVIDEKLTETRRLTSEVKRLKEGHIKLKKLISDRDSRLAELQAKFDKVKATHDKVNADHEEQGRITKDLVALGSSCRGERHVEVIANQRAALTELRAQLRTLEQWPRPAPTHQEALQQVMLLKKELSQMRTRDSLEETVPSMAARCDTAMTQTNTRSAVSMETFELSENSYQRLLTTIAEMVDLEQPPGLHTLAHCSSIEQSRLCCRRQETCNIIAKRIRTLQENLTRKEELLANYEKHLRKLHQLEELSELQGQQVIDLTKEIRLRTEEGECLRVTLEKVRSEGLLDRRHVTAVPEKNLAEKVVNNNKKKAKETAELMRRKNFELTALKAELGLKERHLETLKRQVLSLTESQKHPSPPSGRPSSAKVRRARPTSAKRPMSAKVQGVASSTTRSRSPSGPGMYIRTLVDDAYEIISSTDDVRRSFDIQDGRHQPPAMATDTKAAVEQQRDHSLHRVSFSTPAEDTHMYSTTELTVEGEVTMSADAEARLGSGSGGAVPFSNKGGSSTL